MGRYGGSAGPGLEWRSRGAGDNGGEWIGQVAPTVHWLHDAEEDLRADTASKVGRALRSAPRKGAESGTIRTSFEDRGALRRARPTLAGGAE